MKKDGQLSFRFPHRNDPSIKGQEVWGTLKRNKTILSMRREGKSADEISDKFRISVGRVYQIIKHYREKAL